MWKRLWALGASFSLLAFLQAPGAANNRAESAVSGRLVVENTCMVSDLQAIRNETTGAPVEGLFAALLPILGGIGGDLAKSAVAGLGSAIRRASEEHAYTATGRDGFFAGTLSRLDQNTPTPWYVLEEPKCLMFHVPGSVGKNSLPLSAFFDAIKEQQLQDTNQEKYFLESGNVAGIKTLAPKVYVEIALIPGKEAYLLRPTFVWYREPISSAGTRSRPTELVIQLATPNYNADADPIGSVFGVSRVKLPSMQPSETAYNRDALAGLGAYFVPSRPREGYIEGRLNAANALEAGVAAASIAAQNADRELAAAKRLESDESEPETREARVQAQFAYSDAISAYNLAQERRDDFIEGSSNKRMGATNASVSFVVVRSPSRFGLAIASALEGQKEAIGEVVKSQIVGSPGWAETDTSYLSAMLTVQTEQAELAAAEEEGDATAILAARNELITAKANANQSAVAAGEEPPFPDLLQDVLSKTVD